METSTRCKVHTSRSKEVWSNNAIQLAVNKSTTDDNTERLSLLLKWMGLLIAGSRNAQGLLQWQCSHDAFTWLHCALQPYKIMFLRLFLFTNNEKLCGDMRLTYTLHHRHAHHCVWPIAQRGRCGNGCSFETSPRQDRRPASVQPWVYHPEPCRYYIVCVHGDLPWPAAPGERMCLVWSCIN